MFKIDLYLIRKARDPKVIECVYRDLHSALGGTQVKEEKENL